MRAGRGVRPTPDGRRSPRRGPGHGGRACRGEHEGHAGMGDCCCRRLWAAGRPVGQPAVRDHHRGNAEGAE